MAIEVLWDDSEHTIIRYVFDAHWTWPDLIGAINQSDAMLLEVGHVCHFIYDIRQSNAIPDSALTYLKRFVGKKRANTGVQVVLGRENSRAMSLARGLLNVLTKVYSPDWGLVFAQNLEDAHQSLADQVRLIEGS